MTQKPAANLSGYLAQRGVRVKEVMEITNRSRSTVDGWWKRQDLPMLDNAVKAILWNTTTSKIAKNNATKRKLDQFAAK